MRTLKTITLALAVLLCLLWQGVRLRDMQAQVDTLSAAYEWQDWEISRLTQAVEALQPTEAAEEEETAPGLSIESLIRAYLGEEESTE